MPRKKYTEANMPLGMKAEVRYLKGSRWVTSCHLVDTATDKVVSHGTAICSARDKPVRKIGRAMAIGRALKQFARSQINEN